MPKRITGRTIRQVVRISVGGRRLRVRLSNEFGTKPVVVGAVHVALAGEGPQAVPGSDRPLLFSGKPSGVLLPGAPLLSDPVDLDTAPLDRLAISLHMPGAAELGTVHAGGPQTAYISPAGDFAASTKLPVADRFQHRFFLAGVMVEADAGTHAVVAFGDSLTDGSKSTPDADRRYPDHLARRLHEAGERVAVLNAGIDGNRLLRDGTGPSALARFERDALGHTGVTHIILLEGINDLVRPAAARWRRAARGGFDSVVAFGWPGTAPEPVGDLPSAEDLIGAYRQLIARAQAHGIHIIGGTLLPIGGALADAPGSDDGASDRESLRRAVNHWIRTGGAFDGVIDFEAAVSDPARPGRLLPAFDSGDHVHPNDAGYRAMAEAIDLRLLRTGPSQR